MARRPYNGWTAQERTASGGRARRAYASGRWLRPYRCVVCSLTKDDGATINDHLEDYDDPESRFPLCYRCHMAVHTRFTNPTAFEVYRDMIVKGYTFAPLQGNAWPRFQAEHLRDRPIAESSTGRGDPRGITFLDLLNVEPIDFRALTHSGQGRAPHPTEIVDRPLPVDLYLDADGNPSPGTQEQTLVTARSILIERRGDPV